MLPTGVDGHIAEHGVTNGFDRTCYDGMFVRVLFAHQNCPGQFKHLAPALAGDGHDVIFLGQKGKQTPDGVIRIGYEPYRNTVAGIHPYLRNTEAAMFNGQAVASIATKLRQKGFVPDVMIGNPGWGETLFLKDVWPECPLILLTEFYYNGQGSDLDFDPEFEQGLESRMRARVRNSHHILAIESADFAYSPMEWQRKQFPKPYQSKIHVIHDGIDVDRIRPNEGANFKLPNGRVLTPSDEVLTYVSRNLEPYRGFHSFIRALPKILKARPNAQVVVLGGDDVSYGARSKDGQTWRQTLLREIDPLPDRVSFLGKIPYQNYLSLLQVSSVHLYLTYPFVLSWSMLEAMAAGACVVGSATPPVEEVIQHGENGLLVDFFDIDAMAKQVSAALRHRHKLQNIRTAARETIISRYALTDCLGKQRSLIAEAIAASNR